MADRRHLDWSHRFWPILIGEVVSGCSGGGSHHGERPSTMSRPKQVGIALFGPYVIGVELASMLLMGACWEPITWDDALSPRGGT